jgi:hypothetical protein
VLGYPYCGAGRLQRVLSRHDALACTSGTGLLPLCEVAADTWRQAENRDGPSLSSLAAASIRAMTSSIITTILAGSGKKRWCEIAFADPGSAEIFLEVYPSAKFICMHRSCLDVVYTAVQQAPWGLAGSPFQSFATGYPGNSVAAIAAYWAASTGPLLEFEQAHPSACHRIKYEDLIEDPVRVDDRISSFLALNSDDPAASHWMNDDTPSAAEAPGSIASGAQVPLSWIPTSLTTRVNQLLTLMGYPPIPSSGPPGVSRAG